jgi:hypothetical protein
LSDETTLTREERAFADRPQLLAAEKQRREAIAENAAWRTRSTDSRETPPDLEAEADADETLSAWGAAPRDAGPEIDQIGNILQEAQKLGLNAEEMAILEQTSLADPEAQAALERIAETIILASQRRTSGLQSLFDKKLAQIQAGELEDGDDSDGEAALTDEPEAAEQSEEASLYDRAPDVADLLAQLSEAESQYQQEAILQAALAAREAPGLEQDDYEDADDGGAEELELQLFRLSEQYPAGSKLMRALVQLNAREGSTLEDQLAAAEAFATGREIPVAEVDMNNPRRELKPGFASSVAGGDMNEEMADAILEGFSR